jgi:Phosphotransferase enzyme family
MLRDEALPPAPELLGPAGLELAGEVAAEAGGTVESVEARQALYSPGRSLSVNYHARIAWPDGEPTEQVVAAMADGDGLPEGAPTRRWGGGEVSVWRFPEDPVLTGLEQVLDEHRLADLLGYLDLEPRRVKVTPLVYRPTRRAVVRLSMKGDRLVFDRAAGRVSMQAGKRYIFLKLVRPEHAASIGQLHEELGPHLPIPRVFGAWGDLGLLALEGLPGLTLRDFIRLRDGRPPAPDELLGLLDTLPAAGESADGRVRSMRRRVRSHQYLLQAILPDQAERVQRLGRTLRGLPSERTAIVHGDFYDSQVLVDEAGSISGLLDLDGVGWGNLGDDLASMLGRVWTSGQTGGRGRERFAAYAGEMLESFSRRVDRRDLCMRVAAIVFGRATGPFRTQSDDWQRKALERIELAELCLEHARRGELPA